MSKLSALISRIVNRGHSGLDIVLVGQIKGDEFQATLKHLASLKDVKTIIEIGSSTGAGSTAGIAEGMKKNPSNPQLHAIEFSKRRFARLARRYRNRKDIHCHNCVTVTPSDFLNSSDIAEFSTKYAPDFYPGASTKQVEREFNELLAESIDYISQNALPENGIKTIKDKYGISNFDLAFIDGGPFSGDAELEQVMGAKYIAFDDIYDLKNYKGHMRMMANPDYEMICYSELLRAGFSVFKRKD